MNQLANFRIEIAEDGTLQVYADNGTFAERAPVLREILQSLASGGIVFDEVGQPEQHRHDDPRDRLLAASGVHSHGGYSHSH